VNSEYRKYVRDKVKVETEIQLREKAGDNFRVVKIKWDGPGWYFIYHYSQPCPRGCCHDEVFEAQSASDRTCEIQSKMKDLASHLKEAKELVSCVPDELDELDELDE